MKIRVGIPCSNGGSISSATIAGIKSMKACTDFETEVVYCRGSNIPRARNGMINGETSDLMYQKLSGFDYMLCLDSDIGFTSSHVIQLLSHCEQIVGGLYKKKNRPAVGNGGMLLTSGAVDADRWIPMASTGLRRVDWTGGGFILITRETLEALEYPWFRGELIQDVDSNGLKHQQLTGEDIGFAINARRHNLPIYLDCDCVLEHV